MSTESTILLTGATGLLGRCLLNGFLRTTQVIGIARTKSDGVLSVDLTDFNAIRSVIEHYRPRVILHAAAMTDVDGCERDRSLAWKINVEATRNLVDAVNLEMPNAKIVYLSTDQVYAGPGPSREYQANPQTIYALTKKWAEDIALTRENSLVLRINFLAPGLPHRPGFADWVLKSLSQQQSITLFEDAMCNPLYVDDFNTILPELIMRDVRGTLNVGAHGSGMSKADLALTLARQLNLPTRSISIGRLADSHLPVQRPFDTRMDITAVEQILGFELPNLHQVIKSVAQSWNRRKVEER